MKQWHGIYPVMSEIQTSSTSPKNIPTDQSPGRVVLLTGASSGIGAQLAITLAERWRARIGLLARRTEQLEDVAHRVREVGGEAEVLPCDVVDDEAVRRCVETVEDRFGPVDLAIANAGVGDPLPLHKMGDSARIQRVFRVNLEGPANLFAAVLPQMIERGDGHIAAVSSIAGFRGLPGSAPYCASKAGLSCYLESLRLDLKHRGVAVTTIHPGFVATPMTDKNRFPMPFMMSSERAALILERGLRKRKREINFPWQMVGTMRLLRAMPNWMFDLALSPRRLAEKSPRESATE